MRKQEGAEWNAGKESFPHSAVNNTAGFNRRMRKTACPVVWEG